ncbi:hypothetical protein D3C78_1248690 [compost metagenome]
MQPAKQPVVIAGRPGPADDRLYVEAVRLTDGHRGVPGRYLGREAHRLDGVFQGLVSAGLALDRPGQRDREPLLLLAGLGVPFRDAAVCSQVRQERDRRLLGVHELGEWRGDALDQLPERKV